MSGPFLDRIDLQVDVPRQPDALRDAHQQTKSAKMASQSLQEKVVAAQQRQLERQGCLNRNLSVRLLTEVAVLSDEDHEFLVSAMERLQLSHRAFHRTLRLARTIADLSGEERLRREHLLEALSYRALDNLLTQLRDL
ncbi:MAG: hypothetical protein M1356_04825 [Gammaproteobacteria bacterium]|nr:hypothetical protein [Gammaproteobacteria bacterium]